MVTRDWTSDAVRQLRRAHERLLADEVLGTVRHDLLNRLTGFGAITYQLRRRVERATGLPVDEPTADLFAGLSRQLNLATEMLDRRLMSPPDGATGPRDLPSLVAGLVSSLGSERIALGETAESPPASSLRAVIDERELQVALLCLLDNALDAMTGSGGGRGQPHGSGDGSGDSKPDGGALVRCAVLADGMVAVEILDSGGGVAGDAAERAFTRFFSTKPGHLGLGLNVAATVARRWGGRVELRNRQDGKPGARSALVLPPA